MNHAICVVSAAPIRSNSQDKSEMVSQLLFGEGVEVLEQRGRNWSKVRCLYDNYIGWMDTKQLQPVDSSSLKTYQENTFYALELVQAAMSDADALPITIGANLPNYDGLRFQFNNTFYHYSGQVIDSSTAKATAELAVKIAKKFLHAPYLWGGRSPFGIDCSGLTQVVFKMLGILLERDASDQVNQGEIVDFIHFVQPGDLAFFENKKGNITHVGIIVGEDAILHASGKVRIDKIDHYGIFNVDTHRYTHKLRLVKRHLPTIEKQLELGKKEKRSLVDHDNQVNLFGGENTPVLS